MTEVFLESPMDESPLAEVSSAEAAGNAARVYLRDVRHYPLLTREQEVDLARRMERANARILRILSRLRLTEQLLIETGAAVASGQIPVSEVVLASDDGELVPDPQETAGCKRLKALLS